MLWWLLVVLVASRSCDAFGCFNTSDVAQFLSEGWTMDAEWQGDGAAVVGVLPYADDDARWLSSALFGVDHAPGPCRGLAVHDGELGREAVHVVERVALRGVARTQDEVRQAQFEADVQREAMVAVSDVVVLVLDSLSWDEQLHVAQLAQRYAAAGRRWLIVYDFRHKVSAAEFELFYERRVDGKVGGAVRVHSSAFGSTRAHSVFGHGAFCVSNRNTHGMWMTQYFFVRDDDDHGRSWNRKTLKLIRSELSKYARARDPSPRDRLSALSDSLTRSVLRNLEHFCADDQEYQEQQQQQNGELPPVQQQNQEKEVAMALGREGECDERVVDLTLDGDVITASLRDCCWTLPLQPPAAALLEEVAVNSVAVVAAEKDKQPVFQPEPRQTDETNEARVHNWCASESDHALGLVLSECSWLVLALDRPLDPALSRIEWLTQLRYYERVLLYCVCAALSCIAIFVSFYPVNKDT